MEKETIKFGGTEIRIAVGVDAQKRKPNDIVLTNLRKPVFTVNNHGLETGDVVFLVGTQGSMTSGYFPVNKVDENAFEVLYANFASLSADAVSKIEYHNAIMTRFCDAEKKSVDLGKPTYKERGTNCDEVKQKRGKVEPGSTSFACGYYPDEEVYIKIKDMFEEQTPTYMQMRAPKSRILRGFRCLVESFKYDADHDTDYQLALGFTHNSLSQDVLMPV